VLRVERVGDRSRELQQPARGQPNLSALYTWWRNGRAAVGPLQRHPEEHSIGTLKVKEAVPLSELERASDSKPASMERMNRQRHGDLVQGRRRFGCIL
jgi:hypothetical protein